MSNNEINSANVNEGQQGINTAEGLFAFLDTIGLQEKTISIIKSKRLDYYDLVMLSSDDNELHKIFDDFHDANCIKRNFKSVGDEELKATLTLENGASITLSFQNDASYTVEALCCYLSSILKAQNIAISTVKDNELLLPNVKIVERLLFGNEKYHHLQIANVSSSLNSSVAYNSAETHKKETHIPLSSKSTKNFISTLYAYQPLPKDEVPYTSGMYKEEPKEVVNEKEKEPLVDSEKDTGYTSSKINEGYTNPYSYKDKKTVQPLKKENDDELNIYIKKGYGKVKDSENITATKPNSSEINSNKDQYTKYSSEKRQYRPQSVGGNLISIEDNSSERNKEMYDYSNKYMTNQIDIPSRGGYTSDLGYSSIPMNDLRSQSNAMKGGNDPVNQNMKKGYAGYKGIGSGMNLPYDKSQYQFSKKDFGNYY